MVDLNTANLLMLFLIHLYIIGVDNFHVTLLSIFVLFLIIHDRNKNDLYIIPMLTKSSNFSIINTAHIDLQSDIK